MRIFYLLSSLLLATQVWSKACGLKGSVEERIVECATSKGNFALVYSDEKGREVYKDLKSGLIWSDRISNDFNQYGSQKACSEGFELTDLSDFKWRLPTLNEFEEASKNGIKLSLPNMNHAFWTSTPFKVRSRRKRAVLAGSYIWDATEEKSDSGGLKDGASVRCVAR
jgi:hypothetical protein